MMDSIFLLDLSADRLDERLATLGLPRFRAHQIWQAVYRDLARGYAEITTLSKALRARLEEDLPFTPCVPVAESVSSDRRTSKILFRLRDDQTVETVAMAYPDRRTACVSSQVGCAVGCPFCATGQGGFVRDLTCGEIVAQALHVARWARDDGERLSNIVYMGMGEPLANYDAVMTSVRILNDQDGFGLGARSFTLSTAGHVPGIRRLAREGLQVNLAVSLHAGTDALRGVLVPLNRQHPLNELLRACREYIDATHRRITFEIALIDGVNDTIADARDVSRALRGLLCHVNLIPYNPVPQRAWRRSPSTSVAAYDRELTARGLSSTVRDSRGGEIQAGCGQLRSQNARR